MTSSLNLSKHAWERIIERDIPFDDVAFTLKHARGQVNTASSGDVNVQYYHPATNIVVIVAPRTGEIITMYYNDTPPQTLTIPSIKGDFKITPGTLEALRRNGITMPEIIQVLNEAEYTKHKDWPDIMWSFYSPISKVSVTIRKDTMLITTAKKGN